MCGGKYITRLARSFGLINPRNTAGFRRLDNAIETDPSYYIKSKLAVKSMGRYYLANAQAAAPAPQPEPEVHHEPPPPSPPHPSQFNFGPGPYPWDAQFESMANAFSQFGIGQSQIHDDLNRNYDVRPLF